MMRKFVYLLLLLSGTSFAQTGGLNSFQNLNGFYNARNMGLGGDAICIKDGDPYMGLVNPALLNKNQHNKVSFGQTLLTGGTNTGSLVYARTIKDISGLAHFRYVSYGKMDRTDVNGTNLGSFSPGDFIFGASASKAINERMFIGATLNLLYSQLDNYTSLGTSVDLGGAYINPEKRLVISGVVKNLGVQIKGYTGQRDPLPLEVQLGISHKLEHAPFRFSIIGQNLQRWDLSYVDPTLKNTLDPLTGDTIFVKKDNFIGKTARHLKFQTELLFGTKFHLRVAFDYHRRKEMALVSRGGLSGFSFGAGIYLKRFSLDYGWAVYSAAGGQHALTLTIPLRTN